RGLRARPDERYPAMRQLLDALSTRSRRRALPTALAGAIALLAVGATGHAWLGQKRAVCLGAERKLAGIWDTARKQQVHEAFLKTGVPYAAQQWNATEQALDHYAQSWIAMHTEACEATQLRSEQPDSVLE